MCVFVLYMCLKCVCVCVCVCRDIIYCFVCACVCVYMCECIQEWTIDNSVTRSIAQLGLFVLFLFYFIYF